MQYPRQNRLSAADNPRAAQDHRASIVSARALLMVATIFGVVAALPATSSASQFVPPSLEGFSPGGAHDADGDGDGVNETHVQQYFNAAGDSIYSMTTNGRLWAWSLETKGESNSGPRNYVIRDSNCDGIFDEVYGLDDKYYLPDCVRK